MKGDRVWTTAVAILVLALLAALGWQTIRLQNERLEHAKTQLAHSKQIDTLERAARDASESNRKQEAEWQKLYREVAEDAEVKIEAAARDAGDARAAGERLRQQYAATLAALRSSATGAATAAAAGKAADEALGVLADMQRRLDEAADTIAEFADRSHAAAEAGWAAGEAK